MVSTGGIDDWVVCLTEEISMPPVDLFANESFALSKKSTCIFKKVCYTNWYYHIGTTNLGGESY